MKNYQLLDQISIDKIQLQFNNHFPSNPDTLYVFQNYIVPIYIYSLSTKKNSAVIRIYYLSTAGRSEFLVDY